MIRHNGPHRPPPETSGAEQGPQWQAGYGVQREYDRSELPDEIFFTLYYKEDSYFKDLGYECQTPRQELVQSIEAAKSILTQHYPDCAPLRAILKSADLAIKSLESWRV